VGQACGAAAPAGESYSLTTTNKQTIVASRAAHARGVDVGPRRGRQSGLQQFEMLARLALATKPLHSAPMRSLIRLEHTIAALPADWRKLTVPKLEVMDTTEIKSLQVLLVEERGQLVEQHAIAKAEQRKALKVNCELDIKRIDKIMPWTDLVLKDERRTW
jgi:hypothetical protein